MSVPKDPRMLWSKDAAGAHRRGEACPFLGFVNDVEVRYGYPESGNYCHRVKPPQSVALAQQEGVCLAGGYRLCPVNSDEWAGPLPADLGGIDYSTARIGRKTWLRLAVAGGLLIVVLLLAFIFISKNFSARAALAIPPTPTSTIINPQPTILNSPTFDLPIINPPLTIINTPSPTSAIINLKSTITNSPTATIPIPATPGPLVETPFGPGGIYLVHIVAEGETIDQMAARYHTTTVVLQAINLTNARPVFWSNSPAVIVPGETDPQKVSPMLAVWLEQRTKVADLVLKYAISEEELRTLNSLGPVEWVEGQRWIITPRK